MSSGGGFRGPRLWILTAAGGLALGILLAWLLPGRYDGGQIAVPAWLLAPFAALLLIIAALPVASPRFWHNHFADVAFALGAVVVGYFLFAYREPTERSHGMSAGVAAMLHALREYYAFIALVGGLYVVSGAVLVDLRGRGTPRANTVLLACGALLANIIGTTGASVLLIRPFVRMNAGRLRPIHVVLFIFIVSNCGGLLTPIGDPPLYLGYINGVPFFWPLRHLWSHWLLVNTLLLAAFFVIDRYVGPAAPLPDGPGIASGLRVRGRAGLVCLVLMVAGVFIDPALAAAGRSPAVPAGATFQVLVALAAWRLAPPEILASNEFSFFPVKEVAILFLGIFATMVPALGYLSDHGAALGISSPTSFYFSTGGLSAVLDNAPTYLNFVQVALANPDLNPTAQDTLISVENVRRLVQAGGDRGPGARTLEAISTAAVFFGAATYIGNGPNFMVKAIAQDRGVPMPGVFGYILWSVVILVPVLVLDWAVLIR